MTNKILFVCMGNTCRSPMAQFLLQKMRPDLNVQSAGLCAFNGSKISEETKSILIKEGVSENKLNAFKSKQITNEELNEDNLIFVMEESHIEQLKLMGRTKNVFLLNSENIPDPFGVKDLYSVAQAKIQQGLESLF